MCVIYKKIVNNKIIPIIIIIWLIKQPPFIQGVAGQQPPVPASAVAQQQLENIKDTEKLFETSTAVASFSGERNSSKDDTSNSRTTNNISNVNNTDTQMTLKLKDATARNVYATSDIKILKLTTGNGQNKVAKTSIHFNRRRESVTTVTPFETNSLNSTNQTLAGHQLSQNLLSSHEATATRSQLNLADLRKSTTANTELLVNASRQSVLNASQKLNNNLGRTANFMNQMHLNKELLQTASKLKKPDTHLIESANQPAKKKISNAKEQRAKQKILNTNNLDCKEKGKEGNVEQEIKFEKKLKMSKEKLQENKDCNSKSGTNLTEEQQNPENNLNKIEELNKQRNNRKAPFKTSATTKKLFEKALRTVTQIQNAKAFNKSELYSKTINPLNIFKNFTRTDRKGECSERLNSGLNSTLKLETQKSSNESLKSPRNDEEALSNTFYFRPQFNTEEVNNLLLKQQSEMQDILTRVEKADFKPGVKFYKDLKMVDKEILDIKEQKLREKLLNKKLLAETIQEDKEEVTKAFIKNTQPNRKYFQKLLNKKSLKIQNDHGDFIEENTHELLPRKRSELMGGINMKTFIENKPIREGVKNKILLSSNFFRQKRLKNHILSNQTLKILAKSKTNNSTALLENPLLKNNLKQINKLETPLPAPALVTAIQEKNKSRELETQNVRELNLSAGQKQFGWHAASRRGTNNTQLDSNLNRRAVENDSYLISGLNNAVNVETITKAASTQLSITPTKEKITTNIKLKPTATTEKLSPTAGQKENLLAVQTILTTAYATQAPAPPMIPSKQALNVIGKNLEYSTDHSLVTTTAHNFNNTKLNTVNDEMEIMTPAAVYATSLLQLVSSTTSAGLPYKYTTAASTSSSSLPSPPPTSALLTFDLLSTNLAAVSTSPTPSWPVKHASVMEGSVILGGLMMVHSREDSITCGPIMPQGGIQALEAMLYTLDQVNKQQLLPNITLGAHILDDCDKDTYGLEMAVDFIKGKFGLVFF